MEINKNKEEQINTLSIENLYIYFDKKFNVRIENKFASLVNFSKHKDLPFQRWHYYQEGYSPKLVDEIFTYLNLDPNNSTILDPFTGSGSTLVSAQEKGIKAIGIELNPFSFFMANAKTKNYKSNTLEICKKFNVPDYKENKDVYNNYELSIIDKLYSIENLSKIELLMESFKLVEDLDSQIILKATLFSILEHCSNYKKGGNGLKKRKKPNDADIFIEFNSKLLQVVEDIESKILLSNIKIFYSNVSDLDKLVKDNSIDLSIFSPPYANCFDYFEVYKIELWIGKFVDNYKYLRELRKSALTSNLNADLKKMVRLDEVNSSLFRNVIEKVGCEKHWDKRIPHMLLLYFYDMQNVFKDLYKKQKNKSFVAIVVGNSAYSGIPIATDLILAEIALNCGFKVREIIVARNNETSSQQYSKIGEAVKYIRESIIILEK